MILNEGGRRGGAGLYICPRNGAPTGGFVADSLFTPGEATADMNLLEKTLQQLSVDYELFFVARADGKINVLPPHRRIAETEAIVRHYTKTPPRRTVDRFRFNTLVHRYRTNTERWTRRMRQQEEQGIARWGAPRRAERQALDLTRPQTLAATRVQTGQATGDQVRDVYLAFKTARKARGISVASLNYKDFAEKLAVQLAEARRRAPGRDLELRVDEVGGKVRVAVRTVAPVEAAAGPAGR